MLIGVPKEIKEQEFRVALLPSAAYQLIQRGHQVLVERNAGVGAGFSDAEYEKAGATMLDTTSPSPGLGFSFCLPLGFCSGTPSS